MIIEIVKAEVKTTKGGNSYLPFTYRENGKDILAAAWKHADISVYSGPGKYEAALESQTGKDGKTYINASGLKLISQSPVTPGGTSVSSLDPNGLIRERASTARAAMMCAKDIAIARGQFNTDTVCEIALTLFKQMQDLSTGKPANKETEKEPLGA